MTPTIYPVIAIIAMLIGIPAAAELNFSVEVPQCKPPASKALPAKYYRYEWASKITKTDSTVSGQAEKKYDDPHDTNYLWHELVRLDINGDGWCDWIITSLFPLSNGGDRNSINTFYLGQAIEWLRIGADLREGPNSPDGLGFISSMSQEDLFNLFENASFLYEKTERKIYLIGLFMDRHVRQYSNPGYHIYVWDNAKNKLVELEKRSGRDRRGAVAYAYFKKYGASTGNTREPLSTFDSMYEELELKMDQEKNPAIKK
jgi:hypothetical protein